jgi:hypothetical protein
MNSATIPNAYQESPAPRGSAFDVLVAQLRLARASALDGKVAARIERLLVEIEQGGSGSREHDEVRIREFCYRNSLLSVLALRTCFITLSASLSGDGADVAADSC